MDENVKEVEKTEVDFHELRQNKEKEMREKYADVINDLSVKYGVDVGVAWNYFEAIVRAELGNYAAEYSTDIEYNIVEAIRDYAEILYYSHKCNMTDQ